MAGKVYDGPRCYVGPGGIDVPARFGRTRHLDGGWHYSTRIIRGCEVPHRKLFLDTSGPEPVYRFASRDDESWQDRNPNTNVVAIPGLVGKHPPEAYDDHPEHERWKRARDRQG